MGAVVRRAISLDDPAGVGRTLGDIVSAPALEDPDDDAMVDVENIDVARRACLVAEAAAEAHKREWRDIEARASAARSTYERSAAAAEEWRCVLDVLGSESLIALLSQRQLQIVAAQTWLATLGEPVTNRSIARALNLGPSGYANVATQRRRIVEKLEHLRSADAPMSPHDADVYPIVDR